MKPQPLPSLQILRGIAALLVLLFHITEQYQERFGNSFSWGLFRRGWCGLDLFFVLSGFIIGHIHGDDLDRAGSLRPYIFKRLIRIYPFSWCVLSGAIAGGFILPQFASDRERSLEVLLRSWFLIPGRGLPVLGVAWTLCHEMFFYAVFAIMLSVGRQWAWRVFGVWLAGTFWYSLAHRNFEWPLSAESTASSVDIALKFVLNPLNLEFGFGVALAAGFEWKTLLGWRWLALSLGLAFLLWGKGLTVALGVVLTPHLARVVVYGLAGICLVIYGANGDASREFGKSRGRIITSAQWLAVPSRLLHAVGDASYSLYLIHYPLLVIGCILMKRWIAPSPSLLTWLGFGMVFAVTVAGVITHRLLERPLLRLGRRIFLAPARFHE